MRCLIHVHQIRSAALVQLRGLESLQGIGGNPPKYQHYSTKYVHACLDPFSTPHYSWLKEMPLFVLRIWNHSLPFHTVWNRGDLVSPCISRSSHSNQSSNPVFGFLDSGGCLQAADSNLSRLFWCLLKSPMNAFCSLMTPTAILAQFRLSC